jgi:hypothetical protein
MKNIILFIVSILFVFVSKVFAQPIVEIHEFGAANTQYFIYSSGKTFDFAAENTMAVNTVEVKSWLASDIQANFHIELRIQDSLIAKWDQFVNRVLTYMPYYHTKQVSYSLSQGDTIVYKIYGNGGYREGGLLGPNYVKLTGLPTDIEFVYTTPSEFLLSQNYPNPFNPLTSIQYQFPEKEFVTIRVFDVLGKEVATLVNEEKPAGTYEVIFNASDYSGGVYFYRIQAGNFVEIKKMMLMK